MAKKDEVKRNWYYVDASEETLGRMASKIAMYLMGKNKAEYTPHMDVGDFVIVLNAGKINLTGRKLDNKLYYSHSGYPGGIKEKTAKSLLGTKPEEVITQAVKGMLPKNKLAARMLKRLKIYNEGEHKQRAQQPAKLK